MSRSRDHARLLLVHAAQLPAVALIALATSPWAWLAGGVWASLVCCAGMDSHWRWRNRWLMVLAIAWLIAGAAGAGG